MTARFATQFLSAVALSAMAWVTPAGAQSRYHSNYDHFQRDRHEAEHHRWEDRGESFGHAMSALFRYGTTDPWSSPEHYYGDQQKHYEHYLRDQDRAWDHFRRDRWPTHENDGYFRDDRDYRSGDYYRNDDHRSRDDRDHRR